MTAGRHQCGDLSRRAAESDEGYGHPSTRGERSWTRTRSSRAGSAGSSGYDAVPACASADFTTLSGVEVEPVYGPGRGRRRRGLRADRLAGRVPVHPRALPDRLPRAGPGRSASSPASATPQQTNERYKMILGGRRRRPVGGLRHADADGPRLRRPAVARRGRPLRRRDRLGRRHGGAVRRHPAGGRHDVDDDQRPGGAGVLHVPRRRRAAGRRHRASSTARCRPTSSRSTSRRRSGCSRRSRTCA